VSPDGHLVGSLGEIHAARALNLKLEMASKAGFDATDEEGLRVEIKTTSGLRSPYRRQGPRLND